jgi:1,4-dihydroxy-6-naphthoate synthase
MQYARGQPKEIITEFVKMYVNDITLDMGSEGRSAIEKMFEMARQDGIIERSVKVDVL